MMEIDPVQRFVLCAGIADYVGLWEVAKFVRRSRESITNEALRAITLASLEQLCVAGHIEAGSLLPGGGFASWGLSPRDSMERISSEWAGLTGDPNIGDICWFKNTQAGDRIAHELIG
jgi:hypothetical protein